MGEQFEGVGGEVVEGGGGRREVSFERERCVATT